MSWLSIDDSMPDHPKVLALSDRAFRAHVTGLCYCARHLTDGHIRREMVPKLISKRPETVLNELRNAGLWDDEPDGFSIHDYTDYNPSREKVLALRQAKKDAGKKGADARWGDSTSHGTSDSTSHGTSNGSSSRSGNAPLPNPSPIGPDKPTVPVARDDGSEQQKKEPTRFPAQLARMLPSQMRLTDSQIHLVRDAWTAAPDELRHSMHDIETANSPTGMLITISRRILAQHPLPDHDAKRAGAIRACQREYRKAIADGENPTAIRESLERDYRHDPTIITEALGQPAARESKPNLASGDVPI